MTEVWNIKEWHRAIVSLTQAMMGAVSANFRMVVLERLDSRWHVKYWLEIESEEDREQIVDIDWYFADSLDDTPTTFEVVVAGVDQIIVPVPTQTLLAVFRRRERENGTGA